MLTTTFRSTFVIIGFLTVTVPPAAHAQRSDAKAAERVAPPTGSEIAAVVRAAKLDHGNAATATIGGKPFKFTPAQPGANAGSEAFAGVLENGAPGVDTGLPPGRYNMYIAKVAGQWQAYAESGGQIVRKTTRVTATPGTAGAKPYFTEKNVSDDADADATGSWAPPGPASERPIMWCAGVLIFVPWVMYFEVCW